MSRRGLLLCSQSPATPNQAWVGFLLQSPCYTFCFDGMHLHTHTHTRWRTHSCTWQFAAGSPAGHWFRTVTRNKSLWEKRSKKKKQKNPKGRTLVEEHGIILEEHLSLAQGPEVTEEIQLKLLPALCLWIRNDLFHCPQPLCSPSPPMKRFSSLRGIKKRKDQEGRTGRRQSEPHGLLGTSKKADKANFAALFFFFV